MQKRQLYGIVRTFYFVYTLKGKLYVKCDFVCVEIVHLKYFCIIMHSLPSFLSVIPLHFKILKNISESRFPKSHFLLPVLSKLITGKETFINRLPDGNINLTAANFVPNNDVCCTINIRQTIVLNLWLYNNVA